MAEPSARDRVMARIRRRMPEGDSAARAAAVRQRLAAKTPNLIPARGDGDAEHRIALFTRMMEAVGGSVERVADAGDIPERVAAWLRQLNLPAHLRRGGDRLLAELPWHRAATLEIEAGRAHGGDKAAISRAFAGVAESGTVLLLSGPDNPTTLNFLPEAHVVVLEAEHLHGNYEAAFAAIRAVWPGWVNSFTNTSRARDLDAISDES